MTISRSIHVAANGIISFFVMAWCSQIKKKKMFYLEIGYTPIKNKDFPLKLVALNLSCSLSRGIFDLHCSTWGLLAVACRIFSCNMQTLSCGMWDLIPWPEIEPRSPALGAQSLSPWTSRAVSRWNIVDGIGSCGPLLGDCPWLSSLVFPGSTYLVPSSSAPARPGSQTVC